MKVRELSIASAGWVSAGQAGNPGGRLSSTMRRRLVRLCKLRLRGHGATEDCNLARQTPPQWEQ